MLRLPLTAKLQQIYNQEPGALFLDRDGSIAMTAMHHHVEPSPRGCAYVPLNGPRAFQLVWLGGNTFGVDRLVVSAPRFSSAVRPGPLVEAAAGSSPPRVTQAGRGQLIFFESGTFVVLDEDAGNWRCMNLSTGRLGNPFGYIGLAAHEWTFEAWTDDGELCHIDVDAAQYLTRDADSN